MNNLKPVEKLDALLNYFAVEKSSRVVFSDINKKFETKDSETREVIDRLILDGFIRHINNTHPTGQE